MNDTSGAECRRNSWLVALAGGLLVAVLLVLAGYFLLKALVIGAVFCLVLGIFLTWAFCSVPAQQGQNSREATPVAPPAAAPPAAAPPAAAPPAAAPPAATPPAAAAEAPDAGRPRAPAAFVSATPGAGRAAPAAPASPAAAAPAEAPAERPLSGIGLDAALAKSKDEPPAAAPEMLKVPRGGRADDLKQIKGIGPKLEALLNEAGVWHFDQIASWKAKDIAFVDEKMVGFHGRITRDEWVRQAKVLAQGGTTEFSARVKKGGVY